MAHAVVDASVLVNLLVDHEWGGGRERVLGDRSLAAPAHFDAEVLNAIGGLLRGKVTTERAAGEAIRSLVEFPVKRVALAPLAGPAWSLRNNLSIYDGLYVALAQLLDCELITADRRIAAAPPTGVPIKLITG